MFKLFLDGIPPSCNENASSLYMFTDRTVTNTYCSSALSFTDSHAQFFHKSVLLKKCCIVHKSSLHFISILKI